MNSPTPTDSPSCPAPDPQIHVQQQFVMHLPALRGFVQSFVRDWALVDDVIQETFITVNAKASQFKPGTNFRAWTWTIARHKALQLLEKRARRNECFSPEVIEALCAHEESETAFSERQIALLPVCIGKLAPRARQAVELRYQQAHRPPEIARIMGWTTEAVNVALSRARVVLRECVSRQLANEKI